MNPEDNKCTNCKHARLGIDEYPIYCGLKADRAGDLVWEGKRISPAKVFYIYDIQAVCDEYERYED